MYKTKIKVIYNKVPFVNTRYQHQLMSANNRKMTSKAFLDNVNVKSKVVSASMF